MNLDESLKPSPRALPSRPVSLSPWVNELLPAFEELLTARDVARLTRRARWMVASLALLGRLPRQRRYHGRRIGWIRSEIYEWISSSSVDRAAEPYRTSLHPAQSLWGAFDRLTGPSARRFSRSVSRRRRR